MNEKNFTKDKSCCPAINHSDGSCNLGKEKIGNVCYGKYSWKECSVMVEFIKEISKK